jgi:hypothetical protein
VVILCIRHRRRGSPASSSARLTLARWARRDRGSREAHALTVVGAMYCIAKCRAARAARFQKPADAGYAEGILGMVISSLGVTLTSIGTR